MEPRRSKSSKWTGLPADFVAQVIDVLKKTFADEVQSGKFVVEGRIYPDEILLRVGYLEKGRLKQANFEISMDYTSSKHNVFKLLNVAVDVAGTMLDEYFSSLDDSDFPRIWTSYEVEGVPLHLQFSGTNSDLEKEANELLGEHTDSLVADSEDHLEEIKAKLGLNEEELDVDDDSSGQGGGALPH